MLFPVILDLANHSKLQPKRSELWPTVASRDTNMALSENEST